MSAKITMPSQVSGQVSAFDRFAEKVAEIASRAWFFVFCVLLVVLWAPSIIFLQNIDTWQLIINTATTIITFLLVALLQNTQTRSDLAIHHKLNGISEALIDLMEHQKLSAHDIEELRDAIGLEARESSDGNGSAHK
jgi:low affinity Fe/Cu permease